MNARVLDSPTALPAPRPVVGAQGRHRPVAGGRGRHRPPADPRGGPGSVVEGGHGSVVDGRHRARVTDRVPAGAQRVMAAVVAIAAAGGGGVLLLDLQARTVAQPGQPTPDPATPGSPAAQPLAAQALAAQPLAAQPLAQLSPGRSLPRSAPTHPGTRPPDALALKAPTPDQAPLRRSQSPVRAAERAPTSPAEPSTVDLAGWKLTLPTRGDKGGAALVNALDSGGPWLSRAGSGAVTLWAPSDGATTKNSQHARTELVSQRHFTAGKDARTLRASVAVTQTPSGTRDIILGQIHGAGDMKSVPFVMLHYTAGTIRVVVKNGRSGDEAAKYSLLSGVPLGARFSFTITDAGDGTMVFSATRGADTRRVSAPIPQAFRGATVRFQTGAYQLGKSGGGADEGGRVTFYGLTE